MNYFVEGWGYWFVVAAKNKREAKSIGVEEWGRGMVKDVRRATQQEVDSYVTQKGKRALAI